MRQLFKALLNFFTLEQIIHLVLQQEFPVALP
jgi:hypothetical protein